MISALPKKTFKKIASLHQKMQSLPNEIRHLIYANAMLSFGMGVSSLFLNIYLWKQSSGLQDIVTFNLIQYPAILFAFIVVGIIKTSVKLKQMMGFGFLLYIAGYALLMMLGKHAVEYLLPLGYLFGIATGFYWAGNNTLTFLSTKEKNRDTFYALNASIGSFISVLTPLVSMLVFSQFLLHTQSEYTRYFLLFSVAILIFSFGLYYSLKLPSTHVPKIRARDTINPLKDRMWQIVSLSLFFEGFKGGSAGFIASILTFQVLTTEFDMGLYNSIFALLSAAVAYKMAGRLNKKNRMKFGFVGATLFLFSNIFFIGMFSSTGILISSAIALFANPLFSVGLASSFFRAIDHNPNHKEEYYKYITFRELILTVGRFCGASFFLLFLNIGSQLTMAKVWYLFLGVIPLIYFLLTRHFEKMIEKELAFQSTSLLEEEAQN